MRDRGNELAGWRMHTAPPRQPAASRPTVTMILNFALKSTTYEKVAGGLGFEPRQPESESGVLPLDDPPTGAWRDASDGAVYPTSAPVASLVCDLRAGSFPAASHTRSPAAINLSQPGKFPDPRGGRWRSSHRGQSFAEQPDVRRPDAPRPWAPSRLPSPSGRPSGPPEAPAQGGAGCERTETAVERQAFAGQASAARRRAVGAAQPALSVRRTASRQPATSVLRGPSAKAGEKRRSSRQRSPNPAGSGSRPASSPAR